MKGLLTIISFFFFALCAYAKLDKRALANAYKGANQVNPLMTHRYCADPGVMVYQDTVYVYCTDDGDDPKGISGKNEFSHINCLVVTSSKDLVNWTDHGKIAVAGSGGAAKWAANSWAPHAGYKKINGKDKFFLYFANNGSGVGVLTADSPLGPWKDPIGKPLISGNLCRDVVWCFDPAVYVEQDGSAYLYYGGGVPNGGDASPRTLRVIKLGNDMTSVSGNPITIDAPCSFEDSGVNKIGNTYYYSYCSNWNTGGRMNNAGIMVMTSNSPTGPFTYKGEVLKNPGVFFEGSTGTNHHTIFEFKGQYYIAYHTMTLEKKANGSTLGFRSAHIDPLPFSNGNFGQGKGTWEGPSQVGSLNPYTRVEAETMANQGGIKSVNANNSGNSILEVGSGDWTMVRGVDFSQGLASIVVSVKSSSTGSIKVNVGSNTGTTACNISIPNTGNQFKEVSGNCSGLSGKKDIYFIFEGNMSFDYWKGVSSSGSVPVDPSTPTTTAYNPPAQTTNAPVGTVAPAGSVEEGVCYFIKNLKSNKYLQANPSNRNAEVSSKTGGSEQKWTVQSSTDGYVNFENGNGNFLDVSYGTDENGINIQTYPANGMPAQLFKVVSGSNNAFGIVTGCSSDVRGLDVESGSTADGANVIQYTYSKKNNQLWVFEPCDGSSSSASSGQYPYCSNCVSYYEDQDGKWGVENNDWCKLKSSCNNQSSAVEECTGKNQGYPCCNHCSVYYRDESGDWGVMNDDWCGIRNTC